MSFRQLLNEAKTPPLPGGISKSYLKAGTIKYKLFDFDDDGDLMSGGLW